MMRSVAAALLALALAPAADARMMRVERSEEELKVLHAANLKKSYSYCNDPVSKAQINFPDSLIGRVGTLEEAYSGYVNVTNEDWLFYEVFGSRSDMANDPVVFWTNGGPGCSSQEGTFTEIGPWNLFSIKEACTDTPNCDYSNQLSRNFYGWNAKATLVPVDQPRYVGYSFGYGDEIHSSVDAAADFVTFLQGWFELFPEFKGREMIVAGESYGGHYVPAFVSAIMSYNEGVSAEEQFNLVGAVIGNGCVDDAVQDGSTYIDWAKEMDYLPAGANPKSQAIAQLQVYNNIGYTNNYYDARLESVTCSACYGYNYTAWAEWLLRDDVLEALNVCGEAGEDAFSGSAGGCISLGAFDANDNFDYSAALADALDAGISVTFYYGKQDTACNWVGGLDMANQLPWSQMSDFAAMDMEPLLLGGVEAGQYKQLGKLTFYAVESAGHMVPVDQGVAASTAISTALSMVGA